MRRISGSLLLVLGILFLNAPKAYACGQCSDFFLDWFCPFLKPWLQLFLLWLLIRVVSWAVGKFTKQELSLTYSKGKRPWLSLVIRIGLFIGILIFSMGSILVPSLLIIIPTWFFSLFLSQRKLYSVNNRGSLQNFLLYFQWAVCILIVGIFVNSMVTFNSPERLIARRRDPRNPIARAEQNACVANLKRIQGAIREWAIDTGAAPDAAVTRADIVGGYMKRWPRENEKEYPLPAKANEIPVCPNAEPGHTI